MSQTLYTSDYMSVIGEITSYNIEYLSPNEVEGVELDDTAYRLNLHFTIQVNGKLKTFTHFLELSKYNGIFELKEYRVWYAIIETLGELGYPIGNYDRDRPLDMNFIHKWLELCADELKDPNTYRR